MSRGTHQPPRRANRHRPKSSFDVSARVCGVLRRCSRSARLRLSGSLFGTGAGHRGSAPSRPLHSNGIGTVLAVTQRRSATTARHKAITSMDRCSLGYPTPHALVATRLRHGALEGAGREWASTLIAGVRMTNSTPTPAPCRSRILTYNTGDTLQLASPDGISSVTPFAHTPPARTASASSTDPPNGGPAWTGHSPAGVEARCQTATSRTTARRPSRRHSATPRPCIGPATTHRHDFLDAYVRRTSDQVIDRHVSDP
jgi:hypothetical protein